MIGRLRKHQEGFALFELILSITILGAVIGMVYVIYFQIQGLFGTFSIRERNLRMTSTFVDRLRGDLGGAISFETILPSSSDGGSLNEKGEVILRFVSVLQRGTGPSSRSQVSYVLKKKLDERGHRVFRSERDLFESDDSPVTEILLLENVSKIKSETYDDGKWADGLPAKSGRPELLRLSLVSELNHGGTESAAFVFEIPGTLRSTKSAIFPGGTPPSSKDSQEAASSSQEGGPSSAADESADDADEAGASAVEGSNNENSVTSDPDG